MALSFWPAMLVLCHAKSGLPKNNILMLGRQSLNLCKDDLNLLRKSGYDGSDDRLDLEDEWADLYFERLGYKTIHSLDGSDYEGARIIHNLNLPFEREVEKYDVVLDGGTLEHVFNFPESLKTAMKLTKVGGALLSATPVDGWLGHGFYQPQPELYFRFLSQTYGFEIKGVWFADFNGRKFGSLHQLIDPLINGMRVSTSCKRPLMMLVFAQKTMEADFDQEWPIQSDYASRWNGSSSGTMIHASGGLRSIISRLIKLLLPVQIKSHLRKNLGRKKQSTTIPVESLTIK